MGTPRRANTRTYHLSAPDHERRVIPKPGFRPLATLALGEQDVDRVEGDREEVVKEEQRFGREAVAPRWEEQQELAVKRTSQGSNWSRRYRLTLRAARRALRHGLLQVQSRRNNRPAVRPGWRLYCRWRSSESVSTNLPSQTPCYAKCLIAETHRRPQTSRTTRYSRC
jgi:hypothetical protein